MNKDKYIYIATISCIHHYAFSKPRDAVALLEKAWAQVNGELTEEDIAKAVTRLEKGGEYHIKEIDSCVVAFPLNAPNPKIGKIRYCPGDSSPPKST
jgi:hypothetical protein